MKEGLSPEDFAKMDDYMAESRKLAVKIAKVIRGENVLIAEISLTMILLGVMKHLGYGEQAADSYLDGLKKQYRLLLETDDTSKST